MIPVWNIYLFSFSGVPACHRKDICSLPLYAQDSDLNLTGYLNTFDRCWYDCLSDLILRFWRGGDCRVQEERLGSGGQQLLDAHVENIRVEWSPTYPSRVFATAPKRFLFYKHLGTGIYNDTGLLHGPPGTGKTSFCSALANKVITNSIMLTTMVMVTNFMQVAIQLTGEPGTFTASNISIQCPLFAVIGEEWKTGAEALRQREGEAGRPHHLCRPHD